eukprot:1734890-Pleurochrysis_carterae.AAC.1
MEGGRKEGTAKKFAYCGAWQGKVQHLSRKMYIGHLQNDPSSIIGNLGKRFFLGRSSRAMRTEAGPYALTTC